MSGNRLWCSKCRLHKRSARGPAFGLLCPTCHTPLMVEKARSAVPARGKNYSVECVSCRGEFHCNREDQAPFYCIDCDSEEEGTIRCTCTVCGHEVPVLEDAIGIVGTLKCGVCSGMMNRGERPPKKKMWKKGVQIKQDMYQSGETVFKLKGKNVLIQAKKGLPVEVPLDDLLDFVAEGLESMSEKIEEMKEDLTDPEDSLEKMLRDLERGVS